MSEEGKDFGKDFSENAKKAANEFQDEVRKTFDPNSPDNGKIVAIIAHITVLGWIVALIMNSQNKTEFGSFYIRQTLGIWILTIVLGIIPIIGCFAALIGLVLIIMSLIKAANNKMDPTVVVGDYFQDWFKSL
ncbi:YtxH domain-containing protein [Zobellia sp.]|nr:YtxH domain-containing protein [Zobellia sp.]